MRSGTRQEARDARPPAEPTAALGADDADRRDDPVFSEYGNRDGHRATDRLADRAGHPARHDVGQIRPKAILDRRARRPGVGREHLVEDLGGRERQQGLAECAAVERERRVGRDRDPQRVARRNLVEADRHQADPADDDGGLAGLLGEEPKDRVRGAPQLLGRDVRAAPDDQPRSEAVAGALTVDEAEAGQGPQVAVDRRDRGVEEGAELVGPDLTPVGDRQQDAQAARERRVLGRFFRWSVPRSRALRLHRHHGPVLRGFAGVAPRDVPEFHRPDSAVRTEVRQARPGARSRHQRQP